MKLVSWLALTPREKWYAGATALTATTVVGVIVGCLTGGEINWEALSAIGTLVGAFVTIIAVIVAVIGYKDAARAQRLEHRAYVKLDFRQVVAESLNYLEISGTVRNYGRTPCLVTMSCTTEVVRVRMPRGTGCTFSGGITIPTLHPGEPLRFTIPVLGKFCGSLGADVIADNTIANVSLMLVYQDVFGDAHVDELEASMQDVVVGGNFSP